MSGPVNPFELLEEMDQALMKCFDYDQEQVADPEIIAYHIGLARGTLYRLRNGLGGLLPGWRLIWEEKASEHRRGKTVSDPTRKRCGH